MSKVDEILDALDAGGDRDVKWSIRDGERVLLHYEDGTAVMVQACHVRLEVVPTSPDSGASS
jgi:hypothetical protein